MPWKAFKKENEWCVFKLDQAGKQIGSRLDCHPTEVAANRQVRALEASEMDRQIKEGDEMPEDEVKEELETKAGLGMATSFVELDEMQAAQEMAANMMSVTDQFTGLAQNIMFSEEVEDKAGALQSLAGEFTKRVASETKDISFNLDISGGLDEQSLADKIKQVISNAVTKQAPMKTEGGVKYPAKDYAFVLDREKPSTWKLRLSQGRPGNITISQLGRAAAAFSPGGFRGQKVQIPANAVGRVKSKIRSEYSKLGVKREDMPDSIKALPFQVWKNKETGRYQWLATYSNNIRDDDNPPEIISSESHQNFVKEVDAGNYPFPELWLWHVKEWKFGQATAVAWDDNGFAVAMGDIDQTKEAETVAEWLLEQDDILVSHGMPPQSIERDEKDNTIIVKHQTREISPLPAFAAANKFTGFHILKEVNMPIPTKKVDEFGDKGLAAEVLAGLQSHNEEVDKEATEQELERKENETQETTPVETETTEPQLTRREIEGAFTKLAEVITPLVEQVKALTDEVKEIKEERVSNIPRASLDAVVDNLFNKDTQVDGRSSLAKSKPKETEIQPEDEQFFINQFLGGDRPSILNREVS